MTKFVYSMKNSSVKRINLVAEENVPVKELELIKELVLRELKYSSGTLQKLLD